MIMSKEHSRLQKKARKGGFYRMNTQFKKGALELCVLSQLVHGDKYGYELTERISGEMSIASGTLYPILRRLETAGQLVTYTREHGGRLRRYYRITRDGLGRLEKFNREWRDMRKIYAFIQGEDE